MSAESLGSEIEFVLSNTGQPWEAAVALITDFLRVLHELKVKSGEDQSVVLAQVQAVFGSTTMYHLAKTLDASIAGLPRYDVADDIPLYERTALICKQRSFEPTDGRHLIAHFLKALDEERADEAGNIESAAVMLYWGVGHEAAYHLGGLYVGDLGDIVAIQLGGYLDPTLKRFHKFVEMWHLELARTREEAE
jgi:hypothetical protein